MTIQIINVGTSDLAGDGEPIRSAFIKINENFSEISNNIEDLGDTGVQSIQGIQGITANTDVDGNVIIGFDGQLDTGPVQPYLELTNSPFIVKPAVLGTPVSFTRSSVGSQTDAIDTGLTLARGSNGALYNIELEEQYNNSNHSSPLGTEWNSDGWDNLLKLKARSYGTLRSVLNNVIGQNILDAELIMHDTINDKYYKFDFTDWGQNNGGSFAYTRTSVTDPNFFEKLDYATANNVDVIEDDSTLQVGITRDVNNGIYNPFTEEGWDSNVSPEGTVWNIDGWTDLSDVETRTYTNFYDAYNGQLGNRVPGSQAVMYVPGIEKYYAVQWLNWTQNNQGGGFSYLRYELDLTKLTEGIKFSDGTTLKSAEGIGRVKLTAPGNRRIEEVAGYAQVAVTAKTTSNTITSTTAINGNENQTWQVNIAAAGAERDALLALQNGNAFYKIEISLDQNSWISSYIGGYGENSIQIVFDDGLTLAVSTNDTLYYRIISGGDPVVWWDKNNLSSSGGDFRGAIIDYHAYTGDATWIGTIHIVDDDGEENITHTEVSSGSSDGENDDLWFVQNEGTISYRRIDGESATLKIQWTAKVFYGSELYD